MRNTMTGEQQYLNLANRIITDGVDIKNERAGKVCRTVINADLVYNVGAGEFPLITTRKAFWKAAVAELLGYIRGYGSAEDFRKLGTKTWDANANENGAWLANPFREGTDDMGNVYGVIGRGFSDTKLLSYEASDTTFIARAELLREQGYEEVCWDDSNGFAVWKRNIDQFKKVYDNLKNGIDDRGEIVTFWNPAEFNIGCLRPCMHTHTFSLLGDTLHLTSYQRSCDVPLGLTFNMPQVYVLLAIMAQITNRKAGRAYHKIINAHFYDDQSDAMHELLSRKPFCPPTLKINPNIKTWEDLETWVTVDDFELEGYQHHEHIKIPFSV